MSKTNTHLRVPPGFGALLEGLAREILRDQPKDIPKYAAEYFESLLKNREESGTDPREWAAKLEDQYESNQAYKTSEVASKLTVFNKKTAENYSGQSEDHVSMATSKSSHADDAHLAKSEEEESSPIITQAESTNGPPVASTDPKASTHSQSDELSNEINNSTASSQNNSYSERHDVQLMKEKAMAAQGSESKSEDDDSHLTDKEEDEPGSVNICPTNLEEETADAVSEMEEDGEQKEVLQSNEMRPESLVSQTEITEQRQEEATNDANHVVLTDAALDVGQDKSLVEIDFEDVPENEQTMGENELNMESVKMTTNDTTLSQDEAAQGNERQADDAKEEVNSNHDSYREESIGMDTGDLPTDKSKEDHLERGDTDNIDNEKSSQMDNSEINFDFTHDTTLLAEDTKGAEEEGQPEIEHQRSTGNDAENDVAQLDSNVKIMEKCGNDMSEDDEEQQQQSLDKYLLKELQSEEEEDEHEEEETSEPEVKEGPSSWEQGSINPDLDEKRADSEDIHLQEDLQGTPHPEGDTTGMEECSRPQEEEDIMDIPLDDPEANRAAAKIQAGFRGHMTRKKMKPEDKTEGEEVSSTGEVLSGSQGGTETGGSRPVESNDTSVPEQ